MRSPAAIELTNPVIHDPSNALRIGDPRLTPTVSGEVVVDLASGATAVVTETLTAEDRGVRGAVRGNSGRTMQFSNNSMTNAQSHGFIDYASRPKTLNPADTWIALTGNQTGHVRITDYMDWLRSNGYCFVGASCAQPPPPTP